MNGSNELLPYLKKIGLRLRLRDTWLLAQRTFWIAGLVSVLVLLIGRVWPISDLHAWTALPLAAWLLGVAGFAIFLPLPALRVARRVDSELHLKERLSTSLLIDGHEDSKQARPAAFVPELVEQQHADALHAARSIRPSHDFPLLAELKPLLGASLSLMIALTLLVSPNPMDEVLREREAVQREAERQAEQIEKLREEIAQAEEMTPAEREELERRLSELAEKLRSNPGDREQALADLSQLEEQIRQRLDPKAGQKQAMLEALASQMQALANTEQPSPGDMQAAAQAAQELAEQMQNMTEEERQALAQQLAQMAARAAQAGNSQLAQALAAMSQAAQSGDQSAAQEAADQASEAMQQAEGQMADQRALSQALSQLENSRQSVASSGQPGQQSAQNNPNGQNSQPGQNGQSGQPGQSAQPGQSGQQGQGQGQSQQAGGGGGTNANNLPGATNSGQAGAPQGQGNQGAVSPLDSQVYVPREKRPNGDGELFIPGQDTDQGDTQSTEQRDPLGGVNNPSLMPYQAVYETYLQAANQTLDQSYIPPGMKDYIRDYFSQLEP